MPESEEFYGPDGFTFDLAHDGVPMQFKGSRISWDGDFEQHILRFACVCGLTAEIHTREMDGGPEAVRRRSGRE